MQFQTMKEHNELSISEVKVSVRPSDSPLVQLWTAVLDISEYI
jgi:hypothetical protein